MTDTEASSRGSRSAARPAVTKATVTKVTRSTGSTTGAAAGAKTGSAPSAKTGSGKAKTTASAAKTTTAKTTPVQKSTAASSGAGKATVTRTTVKAATKAAPAKTTTLKSTSLTPAKKGAVEAEPSDTPSRPRGYTPSKKELGLATPRRRGGARVEPPPTNRREAARRQREKARESRVEQRAGMMAGKEEFLMKRDRGPERGLVRDIVDSRRSLATLFIPIALVVILGTSVAAPQIRLVANLLWYAVAVLIIGDSFLLTRKVKRILSERFPKNPLPPRSYYFYAIMRTLSFRRLRMPAPRVKPGDKV